MNSLILKEIYHSNVKHFIFFSCIMMYPNSSKRVKEVIKNSKEKIPFNPITGSEVFLKKIDGMIYGEKPEEGFFVKNTFIHKKLDFSFSFSKSFYFLNNPNYLLGITDKDTKIFFDIDKTKEENTLQYLSEWIKVPERKILDYKSELVNNYKISSGLIKRKKNILQVFAISDENLIYRFVLITNKNEFNIFSEQFEAVAYSFDRVSSNQRLSSLDPPKIRILRNLQDKKFISSIKEKITLQTKYAKEIFETINDLESKPHEKEKIKLIYWLSNSSSLCFATFFSRFCTAAYSLLNLFNAVKYICRSE